ncbi:hypothetical protein MNEG_2289 [Monoraphidium neglectum]|uniref:RNA helicase n=1 Tax=Monoraphidium neglectum TaxID=145388 RepID=A0A0D2K5P4_9CHLO|nr:hypothetical protein MNEG_2289 [Monoraphidium neglectum]KIZ05663.1 hypothetical protein MNEG_2289 [Monoraphidium neglectum]|eukprot:XP_013904682.1 hypothetical protein MNEG_2289 [Monoraphidium neglectum]
MEDTQALLARLSVAQAPRHQRSRLVESMDAQELLRTWQLQREQRQQQQEQQQQQQQQQEQQQQEIEPQQQQEQHSEEGQDAAPQRRAKGEFARAAEPRPLPYQLVLVGATLQPATVKAFAKWSTQDIRLVRAPGPPPAPGLVPAQEARPVAAAAPAATAQEPGAADQGPPSPETAPSPEAAPATEPAPAPETASAPETALPPNLKHTYYLVPRQTPDTAPGARVHALQRLLASKRGAGWRVLAFFETPGKVADAARRLRIGMMEAGEESSWQVSALHGDLTGQQRQQAVAGFAALGPERKLLLLSDVGALGLDLPGVHLVIQLDAPRTWKTYAHRAGRAGRMGAPGESVTVINEVQLRVLAREAARLGLKLGGAPQPTGQRPAAQPERPNKYERKRAVVSGQQQRSVRPG